MFVSMAPELVLSELGKGMKCPFIIFLKVHFLCFWIIIFEPSELHGQSHLLLVDLNKMHLPLKFHVYTRSEDQKTAIFRHFQFVDFTKNLEITTSNGCEFA